MCWFPLTFSTKLFLPHFSYPISFTTIQPDKQSKHLSQSWFLCTCSIYIHLLKSCGLENQIYAKLYYSSLSKSPPSLWPGHHYVTPQLGQFSPKWYFCFYSFLSIVHLTYSNPSDAHTPPHMHTHVHTQTCKPLWCFSFNLVQNVNSSMAYNDSCDMIIGSLSNFILLTFTHCALATMAFLLFLTNSFSP